MEYKTDKYATLRDNFLIRFLGFGWEDWNVTMSKDGKKKTIPELQKTLIDLIEKNEAYTYLRNCFQTVVRNMWGRLAEND